MAEITKRKGPQIPESAEISLLNCIDLSSQDVQSSVSLLKQACLDCGFFYVINHGTDQGFMEEVFSQSKRFFDLPMEEKMKLLKSKKGRGYTPLFDQYLDDHANQKHGDYKEGYFIGIEVSEDHPDAQKPFKGPNRWPSEDILPRWRETMEKYHQKALEVARSVSRLIAIAVGLNANFFDQPEMLQNPIATLRLLHYEDRTSDPANGIFGAAAHSDISLITLLATDDNYGLQICKDKDAKPQIWEYVPPLKGSTLHRVLGNGQQRYSIAFFVTPSHDCILECLSDNNPPKFPPVKCQDYILERYKELVSTSNDPRANV